MTLALSFVASLAAAASPLDERLYNVAILAIAADPSEEEPWLVLRKMRSTSETWEAMELPASLKNEPGLLPLIRCDYYSRWPRFAVHGCANTYRIYADHLRARGDGATAQTVRNTGLAALVHHAAAAYYERRNVDEAQDLVAATANIGNLASAEPEVQAGAYLLLAFIDRRKGRYLHSISNYEHLNALHPGRMPKETRKMLVLLLREVFDSISWDPETGLLRTRDEADFFDIGDGLGHEHEPPKGPDGKRLPYGMTSADEDGATLVTALFADELAEVMGEKADMTVAAIIKQRLLDRNFELPVKVLLSRVELYSDNDTPLDPEVIAQIDAAIVQIDTAIQTADDVPEPTLVAFEVAKRAWRIRSSNGAAVTRATER